MCRLSGLQSALCVLAVVLALGQSLYLLEQGLGLLDLLGQGLDLLSAHGWCLYVQVEACQESLVQLQKVYRFHMQYIVLNITN